MSDSIFWSVEDNEELSHTDLEDAVDEYLDGFEYYARTFRTHHGGGVALAPKWDQDGKPKRCSVEKEKP